MPTCPHGRARLCPFPGCIAGIDGERRAVCGVSAVKYFERGFVERRGELVVGWVEVEAEREEARACGT
jgi:hypothetical protein